MYHPSYETSASSSQPNQRYSSLNRINLDMDMEKLFNTQDYYVGQGSGQRSGVRLSVRLPLKTTLAVPAKAKKDHFAWKEVEMPLFYSKQNQSSKEAKTFETTLGSAQGGLNLNEEADGSGEEPQVGWLGKKEGTTRVLYRLEESGIRYPGKGESGGSGVEKTGRLTVAKRLHVDRRRDKAEVTRKIYTERTIKVLAFPRTAEEIEDQRKRKKSRTTLLMALPEDHLLNSIRWTDAKKLVNNIIAEDEDYDIMASTNSSDSYTESFVTTDGKCMLYPTHDRKLIVTSGPEIEVDYSQFTYGPKQTQPSESESQTSEFDTCESNISTKPSELVSEPVVNESNIECQPKVWSDAPIIEEYESDSEDEYVSTPRKEQETPSFANQQVKTPRETIKNQFTHSQKPKVDKTELGYGFTIRACFVCGSLNHLIRDCDFHEKRMARKAELNNGWNNVQRVNKQNQFVPSAVLTRTVSTVGGKRETAVKPLTVELETTKRQLDYPHRALKNKGIVDSGCSRHMTET
ncbi:hypothetical protein Tco_0320081 [Tanacetum coccineum]